MRGGSMKPNLKIKKRQYLVDNFDVLFDLLTYYKAWGKKVRSSKSVVLWKAGQQENYCKINEIT